MSEQLEKLIEAQIRATNRTTRAIRALVRFFFIQLLGLTLGGFLISSSIGLDRPEALLFFGWLVILAAVLLSSNVAWAELAMSDPDLESGRQNGFFHLPGRSDSAQIVTKARCKCSYADRWRADSLIQTVDGVKICTRCQKPV
jgi:hypothetical protein